MLSELLVVNLGIVEEASVAFGPGLTAITGETGAGKTLLVEALELLLGSRADPGLVRHGADAARVEGRFVTGDEEHVLARVLPADGRSRAYVDGRLATATELSGFGATLVDLHGQHAHQQLLAAAAQRRMLDEYAGPSATEPLAELRAARVRVRALRSELDAVGGDARVRAREADLLRFQIHEIEDARLEDPGEDQALAAEAALLADAAAIREALDSAYQAIEHDALDALGAAVAALGERSPLSDLHDRTRSLQAELTELGRDVRGAADLVVEDPTRLEEVQARRQVLRQICRKYGESPAEVLVYAEDARARLDQLEHHDAHAARIQADIDEAVAVSEDGARRLRAARQRAADPLADAVTEHLRSLAMPHAALGVQVEPGDLNDEGADVVTFMLRANPGEPPRPLARAASGGELARVMLALRLVGVEAPPTLVFDEVDAGIGGEAGTAVGRLLGALGARHQVLCVTHLAQVAAFADHHVIVEKQERGDRTVATATTVDGTDRVRELSRMLAGIGESDHARRHAAELLAAARGGELEARASVQGARR